MSAVIIGNQRSRFGSLAGCFCLTVLAAGAMGAPVGTETKPMGEKGAGQPFAVVELFTSEGCSSCPPADRLLGEVVENARAKGQPIYPLAFHVDYWDRLGWRDPYSDPFCSQRQIAYSQARGDQQVYTPQLVVNGTMAFLGSDRGKLQAAVDTALLRKASFGIEVSIQGNPETESGDTGAVAQSDGDSTRTVEARFRFTGGTPPSGTVLNAALVERGLVSNVARGENAGRKLAHENVVRAFKTFPIGGSSVGQVYFTPPDDVDLGNSSVIVYIQDQKTMAVLAAGAVDVDGSGHSVSSTRGR